MIVMQLKKKPERKSRKQRKKKKCLTIWCLIHLIFLLLPIMVLFYSSMFWSFYVLLYVCVYTVFSVDGCMCVCAFFNFVASAFKIETFRFFFIFVVDYFFFFFVLVFLVFATVSTFIASSKNIFLMLFFLFCIFVSIGYLLTFYGCSLWIFRFVCEPSVRMYMCRFFYI